jgi:cytochrome P450
MSMPTVRYDAGADFQADPLAFLTHLARDYGDYVAFARHGQPHMFINDPEGVHQVLVEQAGSFRRSEYTRLSLGHFLGDSVLTVDGDQHRHQRRLLQPAFHHQHIRRYADTMVTHINMLADRLQPGCKYDILREMSGLTLGIVTEVLFGQSANDALEDMLTLIDVMADSQAQEWLPVGSRAREQAAARADRTLAAINQRIMALIAQRRNDARRDPEHGDLLDLLVNTRDDDGAPLPDKHIRDEVITLFAAGFESTSMTMTWAWLLLAQNPYIAARLAAELDAHIGPRPITAADLPNLRYATMIFRETTRQRPTAWILFMRAVADDVTVNGHMIPKGTQVVISPFVMQHDSRYYPDPEAFEPENFAEGWEKNRTRFTYLSFGGGPRVCIGQQFVVTEASYIIGALAQRYTFAIAPDYQVVIQPETMLRPRDTVFLEAQARLGRP